ncbi:hypothetical protein CYY_009591 [Polysphondylium violaceum]|uniref:SAP domain-containing protein n=1 Tax=Polysphondylium violaceum TaxID=133409 RepID=A0A8J4PK00_9MYCE|nr:hypothetical protein CYY_009591 [Polysphondylium violaceum]
MISHQFQQQCAFDKCSICLGDISFTPSKDITSFEEDNKKLMFEYFEKSTIIGRVCQSCINQFLRYKINLNKKSIEFDNTLPPLPLSQIESNNGFFQSTSPSSFDRFSPISPPTVLNNSNNFNNINSNNNNNNTTTQSNICPPTDDSKSKKLIDICVDYLKTLKTIELHDLLKKIKASKKGSKSKLIERLIRHMFAFKKDNPIPPLNTSTMTEKDLQNTLKKYGATFVRGSRSELIPRLLVYHYLLGGYETCAISTPTTSGNRVSKTPSPRNSIHNSFNNLNNNNNNNTNSKTTTTSNHPTSVQIPIVNNYFRLNQTLESPLSDSVSPRYDYPTPESSPTTSFPSSPNFQIPSSHCFSSPMSSPVSFCNINNNNNNNNNNQLSFLPKLSSSYQNNNNFTLTSNTLPSHVLDNNGSNSSPTHLISNIQTLYNTSSPSSPVQSSPLIKSYQQQQQQIEQPQQLQQQPQQQSVNPQYNNDYFKEYNNVNYYPQLYFDCAPQNSYNDYNLYNNNYYYNSNANNFNNNDNNNNNNYFYDNGASYSIPTISTTTN